MRGIATVLIMFSLADFAGGAFAQLRLDEGAADRPAGPAKAIPEFWSICIRNGTESTISYMMLSEATPPNWNHYELKPGEESQVSYFSRKKITISYHPNQETKATYTTNELTARRTTRDECYFASRYEFRGTPTMLFLRERGK
mgnify:CR=1 FL=1